MAMRLESFDVVVVGGGPGGSTAATFAAMEGARVLLLESERFPRYHVGESLMAATVQGLCKALGVIDELRDSTFVRKPGGVFRWGQGQDLWRLSFTQAQQLSVRGSNYALHVERAIFDDLLVKNARRNGVEVREGSNVENAILDDGRVSGVVYRSPDGMHHTIRAHFVVDASGYSSRLYPLVGNRVFSRFFHNVALFCYFDSAERLPPPLQGGGISEAFEEGWMWFLPLSSRLTSVGAVIGAERAKLMQGHHDEAMRQFVDACPYVRNLLLPSKRVTDGPYGRLRVRGDFSYTNHRFWRPGLVLVGDAACFLDPLFTTGVHLSSYAGLLAARSINSVLSGKVDEAAAFEEFELRYRLEFESFYNFVIAFYDMNEADDEGFWHSRKVERTAERQNPDFIRLLTCGRDEPDAYFNAKQGIGARAQALVDRVKLATSSEEHIALCRAMAEELHTSFRPPSGPRPFHLGFEDIREMSWGREHVCKNALETSRHGLIPTENGRAWRTA
jgi:halogenation protein CepH